MKTVAKTTALIMASLLVTTTFSGTVFADTTGEKKPATETVATTAGDMIVLDSIKVSGHAKSVLSNVHNARLALFEGKTEMAVQLVNKAHEAFQGDVEKYSIKLDGDQNYGVPLDYSIEMAEEFKPTKDNAAAIAKAGQLAQKGDTSAAVKIMAVAGVELSVKYAMLPAAKTMNKLDKVVANLKEQKFYEANLTLKSIETSMLIEDFELSAAPKQGHDLKDIL